MPGIPPTGIVNLLIWAIGLASLSALTLYDFLPLLSDYRHNNVATRISVLKNLTIKPDNITVCLPYFSGSLTRLYSHWVSTLKNETPEPCDECQAMKNHSWDVWKEIDFVAVANSDRRAYENQLASEILRRLLDDRSSENFEILSMNSSNFNWNQPLIDTIWEFFACISHHDIFFLTGTYNKVTCDHLNLTLLGDQPPMIIDQLFNRLSDFLNLYLNIDARSDTDQVIDNAIFDHRSILLPFGDKFCFPMLFPEAVSESYVFTDLSDQFDPPWHRYPRSGEFEVYQGLDILYAGIRSYESLYETDKAKRDYANQEKVSLMYNVETRVIEVRPNRTCSTDTMSPAVCLAQRQVFEAIRTCRCIPFTYRKVISHDPTLPYCTPTLYSTCLQYLTESRDRYLEECSNKCEYVFYKWRQSVHAKADKASKNQTFNITIRAMPTPFTQFTITLKESQEKFLAQVGGLINLYLGISGLSLCSFVIFCMDLIRKCYQLRRRPQTASFGQDLLSMTVLPGMRRPADGASMDENAFAGISCIELWKEIRDLKDEVSKLQKQVSDVCKKLEKT